MLDTFGFPTPQGANYQEFYGGGTIRDWVKPRGASMVRFLLIGAGSGGRAGSTTAGGGGGSSGAVTQWIGPAIFVPDILRVTVGAGGASATNGVDTTIIYQNRTVTATLLVANAASVLSGGSAASNNPFGASGKFRSIGGQTGAAAATAITASTTTFLSGGAGGSGTTTLPGANVACNYGYPTLAGGTSSAGNGRDGYFLTQPIMIGCGGSGGGGQAATGAGGNGGNGGIGCGGGGGGIGTTSGASLGGRGGDGAVFIWSW